MSFVRTLVVLLVAVAVTGCGGSTNTGSPDEYPIVESPEPERQPPVTTPEGAIVTFTVPPTVYEVDPSPTCERAIATFHGSQPGRRPVVIPPAPGLRAVAVTEHTTRLEWSFHEFPDDCRPVQLALAVVKHGDVGATPTVARVDITGLTGTAEVTYPDFLPAPTVAHASAYAEDGHRSRTVSILIERPANTPSDPPEPIPPVTAPAAEPVTCIGQVTTVEDPAGDVLTYGVGKTPTQVRKMTPALSGIDLVRAAVQIDGRTVCATFTFARALTHADFRLSFHLHDTSEPSCCTTLRFQRTAGRLEVGAHSTVDGVYQLVPTANAGAALRGATLVFSGDLAEPSKWQQRARRMPDVESLAWSITTGYFEDKYGPYFGDWLPTHKPVGQPAIRHSDGTPVRPGG